MSDTSAYLVTPPSLFFPRRGITFSLLTHNSKWVENFMELAEQQFPGTTLTFFAAHEEESNEHYVWSFQQTALADFVIVDMDSATELDIQLALIISKNKRVWWEFADEDAFATFQSLLNITQASMVDSSEEFFALISDIDNV
jgi:hypothetical protein